MKEIKIDLFAAKTIIICLSIGFMVEFGQYGLATFFGSMMFFIIMRDFNCLVSHLLSLILIDLEIKNKNHD